MGGEMICKFLVVFFKFSVSGWVSLTIDEGVAIFSTGISEPKLLSFNEMSEEFFYPVQMLDVLDFYAGKKIVGVYEYRIKGVEEGCVGVYFDCGECGFSVLENDSCLSIVNGVQNFFRDEVVLSKLYG
jgi:hypothetical protein